MKINIFMATAGDMWEREILKSMGAGIDSWVRQNPQSWQDNLPVRIGRWSQYDVPQDANTLDYVYVEGYEPCDVAIMFGSWKTREKGTHNTRNQIATMAKRFLCIETALLGRHTDRENTHFRIGVNGYLNQDAEWPNFDSQIGNTRLARLGLSWPGWQNAQDGHIVVCLQLPGDASLRGADINDWAWRAITQIRLVTDRAITVRCHPLVSARGFESHADLVTQVIMQQVPNITFSDGATRAWHDDLQGAWCTVTYTSGLAIDSIVSGVPTVACDPGNFAWPISSHDPREVIDLKHESDHRVLAWLQQLALCQWTQDEMRSGEAWQMYLPVLERS
jgi:hypothetical protein